LGAVLDAAGDARLVERADRFAARSVAEGPAQALFAGLADALGYSQNRDPSARPAAALPYARCRALLAARGPLSLEAALLGAAGLLPPPELPGFAADPRPGRLQRHWDQFALAPALSAT